jgi:hypothetical protein
MKTHDTTKKVYLDSNVLISMSDGHADDLKSEVIKAVENGTTVYPFSATQISEITNKSLTDRCNYRLKFISEISQNIYFAYSIYDYEFRIESPFSVWETINEVSFEPNENKLFANFIPFDQFRALREQLSLDPNFLNNLNGREAIACIDSALLASAPDGVDTPRSVKELLDVVKGITREQFSPLWDRLGTTEQQMTLSDDIVGVFSLLESFGYWPDSEKIYKKGSRFPDGQHVFNASHFDVIVTSDRGMKNRAEAVYAVLGIDTAVMNRDEYKLHIKGS